MNRSKSAKKKSDSASKKILKKIDFDDNPIEIEEREKEYIVPIRNEDMKNSQ